MNYPFEEEINDENAFDRIDQAEIDELLAEPSDQRDQQDLNPTNRAEIEIAEQEEQEEDDVLPEEEEEDVVPENVITDDDDDDDDDDDGTETESSRPTRERSQPDRLTYQATELDATKAEDEWHKLEQCHNLLAQVHPNPGWDRSYTPEKAMVIARVMSDINSKTTIEGASFAQQYIVQRGLKKFGQRGADAATKEMDQLHRRNCFSPIDVASLTTEERRKTVDALMFLGEKRDKSIKGRMVYNGKPTREWLSREDATSPTAALESIMLTAIVDAKEGRDVMTCDIPNALC
jgi:hypothetical protein